ncbi:MAG: sulfatase-like hydrolase/transferase [Phycisphaera sp.]|nr:sulfatase-like hydrolase/transferase [Phycisphaera sp.]
MPTDQTFSRREMLARMGWTAATVALASCSAVKAESASAHTPGPAALHRPNIIFILTDDQRYDAMSCMGHPIVKTPNMDRLRREGVLFQNAFVTTSLCSPARASFLTGAYVHTHGVIGNWGCEIDHDATPTFPRLLHDAGYRTAFVGKWHMKHTNQPRPGFDYWLAFAGQGVYNDPTLNENGREFKATGYITDLLTDYALNFINQQNPDQPYCLYLSHKAVHSPFTPAPRHENIYPDAQIPEPPSFQDTKAGKPAWQRGGIADPRYQQPRDVPDSITPGPWDPNNARRLGYLRTLSAVDDSLGRILKTLEERGELDNTLILYTSDNGYFFGEHGLGDKRLMYEESLRIPMLMRYPPLVKPNSTVTQMVLNIDVAPTLLDLADVPAPATVQGRSVLPLLAGKTAGWRTSFLYEYWIDLTDRIPRMVGVRTDGWKLIRYPDLQDIDEMYDLTADPTEMTNLAQDPKYAEQHQQLNAELNRLMIETGYGSKPIPKEPRVTWPAKTEH